MKNVKITVLRKGFYPDLIREHLTEPPEECVCDFFREGDQFPLAAAGGGQCGVLYRRAAPGDLPVGGPMRKRRPHNAGAALVM